MTYRSRLRVALLVGAAATSLSALEQVPPATSENERADVDESNVHVGDSYEARTALRRADRLAEAKRWREAAQAYHDTLASVSAPNDRQYRAVVDDEVSVNEDAVVLDEIAEAGNAHINEHGRIVGVVVYELVGPKFIQDVIRKYRIDSSVQSFEIVFGRLVMGAVCAH